MSTHLSPVTRRRFLAWSGVAAAAGLGVGATQVDWGDLLHRAAHDPLRPGQGVLVVVTLYGGNDGLNTVVPASDDAYQDARPELAYDAGDVLDLGEDLGLNPGMTGLKDLWDDGSLAVVRGVGYPEPDHSHFRSMAIWQTASPTSPTGSGWLGRWLDVAGEGVGDDPLRAVSMDSVLPPLLAGDRTSASTLPPGGVRLPDGPLGAAFRGLAATDPADDAMRARVARSGADLARVEQVLGPTIAASKAAAPADDAAGQAAGQKGGTAGKGGRSELATQLQTVAALVEARVPTRVYSVSLGGFDTHADERDTQQRLLTELDGALAPFARRLAGTDAGRQVVTLVYSEFGRRVAANASQGTDHGTASPVFLLGDAVAGGFAGEQPSLTDLDDGDLRAHVDFRDVYATVLGGVLGADPARVLGPGRAPLGGLLRST